MGALVSYGFVKKQTKAETELQKKKNETHSGTALVFGITIPLETTFHWSYKTLTRR